LGFVRLILHIGTPKTGTSALQKCLQLNEISLADKGIYYAHMARSPASDCLANWVANRRRDDVQAFVDRHLKKASAIGANILIISAVPFYAMTTFFHKLDGRKYQDYWESESEAIEFFHSVLPPEMPTRLIVFFRRQDHFLESMYRQMVRSARGVALRIDEFMVLIKEALDYRHHMEIWSTSFSDCAVYSYEQVSNNSTEFFLRNVLQLVSTEGFRGLDSRLNNRLSRDVLEYKRVLNSMEMSDVDRQMSKFACTELARTLTDDGRYQDYLAPAARAALLRDVARDNAVLSQTFGMEPFPILSDDGLRSWAPYTGLSAKKARELAERHARIRKSISYRIERSALLAEQRIQRRLPRLAWIIPVGRFLLRQLQRAQARACVATSHHNQQQRGLERSTPLQGSSGST
jgi:hypothetical protein